MYRSRKNTDADSPNTSGEKGSLTKGHSEAEGKSGGTSGAMVGQFHQLPHYYKLYEVIKGAFSNYKVRFEKQCSLKEISLSHSHFHPYHKNEFGMVPTNKFIMLRR